MRTIDVEAQQELAKVAAAFFGRIRSLNDSKKELEELEKKT